jgi:hypothetical protein
MKAQGDKPLIASCIEREVLHADRLHDLEEQTAAKAATGDLIVHVLLVFLDADRCPPLGRSA